MASMADGSVIGAELDGLKRMHVNPSILPGHTRAQLLAVQDRAMLQKRHELLSDPV